MRLWVLFTCCEVAIVLLLLLKSEMLLLLSEMG